MSYNGEGIWVNWDILKEFGYDHTFHTTYTELYELADAINASGTYVAWDGPIYVDGWFARSMWSLLTMDVYKDVLGGTIDPPQAVQESNKLVLTLDNQLPKMCDGSMWVSNNPSMQEAYLQQKRYVDSFPGGGAAFYDPARPQGSEQWLAGVAAMSHNMGLYGAIRQAMMDGVLMVEDWGVVGFPQLTKEELFNKDLPIYFEGKYFQIGGGAGDNFAPTPNVRTSGEDPNVDLMVRDFFQFMSSAEVTEIYARETGAISLNPDVFQAVDPRLADVLKVRNQIWLGVTQPPGSYANYTLYQNDPEFNIRAWFADQISFEEAMQRADENATKEYVRRAETTLSDRGEELPDVCKPWGTTQ
jgi:ABC-type glycerol-3-phosphate transport system substrate-binding protein